MILEQVNVYIKHDNWVRWEFETKAKIFVEEIEESVDTFGLELRDNDKASVFVVMSDDYSVMEDVTHLFEVDHLVERFKKLNVSEIDHTQHYLEWLKEQEV